MSPKLAPSVKLNNGKKMPIHGLGTWKSKPGEVTQAVKDAIACGYRHLDCALVYGNEAEVGVAIKAKIEDGTVKREDLFITSKLWNTFHSKSLVVPTLKESLTNLGLDYLDLYLIHWPMGYKENAELFPKDDKGKFLFTDVDYLDTWSGMEDAVAQGLTKSIGVSNYNSEQIQRTLDNCKIKPVTNQEGGEKFPTNADGTTAFSDVDYIEAWQGLEDALSQGLVHSIGVSNFNKDQIERVLSSGNIVPVTNQIECHPYLNQKKLIDWCRTKNIYITAYSPLGSPDRPWAKPEDPLLLEEPKLVAIAEKYKRTPAQIAIRYQVQRDVIVIPKSVTKSRIESNLQVFDFKLSSEDMKTIDSFDCNGRALHLDWVKEHKYWPFNTEF
ncbi:hypothetical protein Pmani_006143 [Petrolisthes manimaculis]|uniref:NADP-dependent oxidoreductase domain-containing protein n=1 Tax=Petrolisthes manimaculis TaxID=1843537 RepID=A0AAE1QCF0_9EUCA|nr:hypothetical protein Pmani_006143 [Petrolisthes manimaculis]